MGSTIVTTDFTETIKFVVMELRLYATAGYTVNQIYYNDGTNQNNSIVLSGIRYDGATNYIVARNVSFNFQYNRFGTSIGYRQDTYKTSTTDNYALVPFKVTAFY